MKKKKENIEENIEVNKVETNNLPAVKKKSKFWTKALSIALTVFGLSKAMSVKIDEKHEPSYDDTKITDSAEQDVIEEENKALEDLGAELPGYKLEYKVPHINGIYGVNINNPNGKFDWMVNNPNGISDKYISDKDISDKDISDKDIPDKDIPDKDISDKDISDKDISDKDISDKDISDKDISDKVISDKVISDKAISDKVISDKVISDKDIPDKDIPDKGIYNYLSDKVNTDIDLSLLEEEKNEDQPDRGER